MKIKALIAAVVLSISTMTANASVYKLPTTTIHGKEYYYHEVKAKETLYSLSHELGMSQDEMKKYNPSLAEGLKAGTNLYFPVDELGGADVKVVHKVKKGETVYGISKEYHISIEQLLQLNPSAQDGIKVGDELLIKRNVDSAPKSSAITQTKSSDQGKLHIIKTGETLYAIAAKYNTTIDNLLMLNPTLSIDKYDVGTVIRINNQAPLATNNNAEDAEVGAKQSLTVVSRPEYVDEKTSVTITKSNEVYNIAILMPFMLNEEKIDSKTNAYLDFYKGFILAADSLKTSGAKVKIYAYDTYRSVDSVKVLLQRPEISQMDVIITPPGSSEAVLQVASLSDSINAKVFNAFYANDTTHYIHENVIQANIVRDNMYDKAISVLVDEYADYIPVIIGSTANKNRATLVEEIKRKYEEIGVTSQEIIYNKKLTATDLSELKRGVKYLFIPLSSTESEFNKYSAALTEFIQADLENNATFGYPEWTAFKGEKLTALHNLNAVVYSRFFYNGEGEKEKAFEAKFEAVYKTAMKKMPPIQAVMGFDCGYYIINALRQTKGYLAQYKYEGLQYTFDLNGLGEGKGVENQALYFIYYRPNKKIEKQVF